jgi:hypothetical protein
VDFSLKISGGRETNRNLFWVCPSHLTAV